MAHDRLTASDAAFLRIETPHEPQHVGSLSILDGGPLRDASGRIRIEELREHIGRRLHRVPRLRHRVMDVPYGQGRPIWVDDDGFDLEYHVRLTSLPRPGDEAQLLDLMGRLQSLALDRRRPLWEIWFIDGMADDDIGMIIKTHHAMGDGIANVDLALALVDLDPEVVDEEEPPAWSPRSAPTPRRLLADSVWDQAQRPGQIARAVLGAVRDPGPAIESVGNVVRAASDFTKSTEPAPWNQPVSPHRRWVHADIPMSLVREVRAAHEVTVNDVVLAACTGALRAFLLDRDVDVADRELKAMVPVSLRNDDEHGATLGNRVSLIVVDLPVDEPDPVRRLVELHRRTVELRQSGLVDGADSIVRLADGVPLLSTQLTRLVSRRIPMNLVITNIPGPPVPLYLRGARVLRTYPYVEVIDNEGLTIAVVSYEDQLFFGITSDRDVLPDLALVAEGIEKEFQALAAGAGA